jgi:hypothetical protein
MLAPSASNASAIAVTACASSLPTERPESRSASRPSPKAPIANWVTVNMMTSGG